MGGTGFQSPPGLGDLGGKNLIGEKNVSSPPSPPTLGGTGFQSPPGLGDLGGKNLRGEKNVSSPPSPPTLGGTGFQSPPGLGDLGGKNLRGDGKDFYVPPILTKTWYHTGAWQRYGSLSRQYEKEYFQGDSQAYQFPDSIFADLHGEVDAETSRQAYWTLKGMVLREEVYGLDGSDLEDKPYAVTETNYHVKLLQPKGDNKYGVYFVEPRETLSYQYERNADDPRISHQFVLKVDDYGNVLRSCTVAYGRRQPTPNLPTPNPSEEGNQEGNVRPEQLSLKVISEDNRFINITGEDINLLGVPLENKSYEITNITLKPGEQYFSFAEVDDYLEQVLDSDASRLLTWQRHYYWSPEQEKSLPWGEVSPEALPYQTEVAEFDREQVQEAFNSALNQDQLKNLLSTEGGYQLKDNYWWNPGLTQTYNSADKFFLPKATIDPFGNATTYDYDAYNLLTVKVTDALSNEMVVEKVDYQTLQTQRIRDINQNISEVLFDPMGMVVVTSFYGTENGESQGFEPLEDYQIKELPNLEELMANPQDYLQGAASYFYYDLFAWKENNVPVHAVNLIAEDYPNNGNARILTNISYSDGFGRELQSKVKADAGTAFFVKADGSIETEVSSDRWLTSGRKVYNNKGNPVKQYEPYYLNTYEYVNNEILNQFGVSDTLYYDPLERVIRTETAKGFFSKVEFTPWGERYFDENDTIKDSPYYKANNPSQPDPSSPYYNSNLTAQERAALTKAAVFYHTPEEKILDNLGRIIQDIQQKEDVTKLITHYEWDIQGNQLSSADPRLSASGKENFRMTYTMNGVVLKTVSVDAGTDWVLHNVVGNSIYGRDSRNFEMTTEYDALHRPVAVRVQGGDGATPLNQIVERTFYGDSLDARGNPVVSQPEQQNLRGQVYRHFDEAGMITSEAYNILGLPLVTHQQLNHNYQQTVNWSDISAETLRETLESDNYVTQSQYDALGRITVTINPDSSVYQPTYHLSGWLNQIRMDGEVYVQSIDYNPKGQRQTIVYGNGVTTRYAYETTTFRLTQILTIRESDSKRLQDLNYTYDAVGNITHITDKAQELVFNANQQVNPESEYTYDALYRLIKATGREHPALSPQNAQRGGFDDNWVLPIQPTNNGQALQNYMRRFSYDDGGNLYRIQHHGAKDRTRNLTVSDSSNRAVDSELTEKPEEVSSYFDGNGNQTRMLGLKGIAWDYRNNMSRVTVIERQNTPSDREYYVYDSTGKRVRKVRESYGNGGAVARIEETIYLGMLEIKRISQGGMVVEERHSIRVMDDQTAVATRIVWTEGTPPNGTKNPQIRYQLDNHLGSATMEIDVEGQIISYEEYFPYGGTALVAGRSLSEVKLKQYRYSGKERDSVTGFYYYGARYYVPWLGRWLKPDPAGTVDGLNLYGFVGGNPIRYADARGLVKAKKAAVTKAPAKKAKKAAVTKAPAKKAAVTKAPATKVAATNKFDWVIKPSENVLVEDINLQALVDHYGQPTTEVVKTYSDLANQIKYDIGSDRKGILSLNTTKDLYELFRASKPLHFNYNPILGNFWKQSLDEYTGSKQMIPLYSTMRSKATEEFKNISLHNTNLNSFLKEASGRPAEIHHLIFKAVIPDYANQITNLMLTQRSKREKEFGPGQHELMHMVATGNHKDKFNKLLPQFIEAYKDWLKQEGTLSFIVSLNK
ncbi:toxin TcdB middle/C-terminal domain-containing protein [Moorena sp. SIO4G3]|uniref:toxin TcdB middle/C-terminal domain-containing protein n=1 Tax=Moorena sp. SIO4G3 TaxID=2607821 RepID=UPI0025ECE8A1|nr:toxin TcdB middle/C-terminal domain-containing protein [Moorena sp. SIO4G3]